MNEIQHWLKVAKENSLKVINMASVDDLAICLNILDIPKVDTSAITISVMKQGKKKNSLPPFCFAKVMRVFENLLEKLKNDEDSAYFKQVGTETKWYKVLDCHRIFFIPAPSVGDFLSLLLSKQGINLIKAQGLSEVYIIANTKYYNFSAGF